MSRSLRLRNSMQYCVEVAEDEQLWALLIAVTANEPDAWPELLAELAPMITQFAKRQPIGRLGDREDTPREIVTRVIARLHARDHAAIHKLCAAEPRPELQAWFRVLVRRSAIDYMRESPEYERASQQWISLATLSSGAPSPEPDTLGEKRREVTAFVRDAVARAAAESRDHGEDAEARLAAEWKIARVHVRRLIARGEQYMAVLAAVLAGRSYSEIAELLAITRREVELTVRYIEDLLRERGFGAK